MRSQFHSSRTRVTVSFLSHLLDERQSVFYVLLTQQHLLLQLVARFPQEVHLRRRWIERWLRSRTSLLPSACAFCALRQVLVPMSCLSSVLSFVRSPESVLSVDLIAGCQLHSLFLLDHLITVDWDHLRSASPSFLASSSLVS